MAFVNAARESQQDTDAGNRGSVAKQRSGIVEQPKVGELPIKCPIARVAIEAHRQRLIVVHSLRRADRLLHRFHGAILIFTARRGRRHATLRRLPRLGRERGQRQL
jgi:hypothetical protein